MFFGVCILVLFSGDLELFLFSLSLDVIKFFFTSLNFSFTSSMKSFFSCVERGFPETMASVFFEGKKYKTSTSLRKS